jgi:hypothetical protein
MDTNGAAFHLDVDGGFYLVGGVGGGGNGAGGGSGGEGVSCAAFPDACINGVFVDNFYKLDIGSARHCVFEAGTFVLPVGGDAPDDGVGVAN